MRIAFYAPMKSPDHPVPSGDRTMARLLIAALRAAGHQVELAATLRTYTKTPDPDALNLHQRQAKQIISTVMKKWQTDAPDQAPHCWLTYHPYYKSLDLIGPEIAQALSIPYLTAEASYAPKHDHDNWQRHQDILKSTLRQADLHFVFSARDKAGLAALVDSARLRDLPPFVDTSEFPSTKHTRPSDQALQLIAVAMMRPGDKLKSYKTLADAFRRLDTLPLHLTIVGDGSECAKVKTHFASFGEDRITWRGALSRTETLEAISHADILVWPGYGEGFGMVYLEAAALGVPSIAFRTAGVPEAIVHDTTGHLVDQLTPEAFANAIRMLATNPERRAKLAASAPSFIAKERSLQATAARITAALTVPAEKTD